MKQPSPGPRTLLDAWPLFAARPVRSRGVIAAAAVVLFGLALAKDGVRAAVGLARMTPLRALDWYPPPREDDRLPAVRAAVEALQASGAQGFRLSPGITQDEFLRQRISEMAWPLPVDAAAAVIVRLAGEPSSCHQMMPDQEVAVDRCD